MEALQSYLSGGVSEQLLFYVAVTNIVCEEDSLIPQELDLLCLHAGLAPPARLHNLLILRFSDL